MRTSVERDQPGIVNRLHLKRHNLRRLEDLEVAVVARAESRHREMAVRAAQLPNQLGAESTPRQADDDGPPVYSTLEGDGWSMSLQFHSALKVVIDPGARGNSVVGSSPDAPDRTPAR